MSDESTETPEPIGIRAARARLRYSRQINAVEDSVDMHMGGDATVGELVSLMVVMGWQPPGDQAVAEAAQIKVAWPEDAKSLLAEADARVAWESLGFGADFAERVEAALESDPLEEIGILQARVEDQDRKIADLTRQLQGQPRRQSDVSADTWQPIATAPKDRVIDLWSAEGGRYPDAIWDVCCDAEGWTDANDHRSLAGYLFTHWMDRPAGPTEGGE